MTEVMNAPVDREWRPEQPAPCPHCGESSGGRIFQDARGGYECTCCDARFRIWQEPPFGYGGPGGYLSWRERNTEFLDRWGYALAGATGAAMAEARWGTSVILGAASLSLMLAAHGWKVTWRVP